MKKATSIVIKSDSPELPSKFSSQISETVWKPANERDDSSECYLSLTLRREEN